METVFVGKPPRLKLQLRNLKEIQVKENWSKFYYSV